MKRPLNKANKKLKFHLKQTNILEFSLSFLFDHMNAMIERLQFSSVQCLWMNFVSKPHAKGLLQKHGLNGVKFKNHHYWFSSVVLMASVCPNNYHVFPCAS